MTYKHDRGIFVDRGFLPKPDPIEELQDERFSTIEKIAKDLPELLSIAKVRSVLDELNPIQVADLEGQQLDRVMLLYSYFASAYVWAHNMEPSKVIPKGVAVPLVELAKKVGRPPILAYDSYCLNNWRRIDPKGPIELGNIELIQNFLGDYDEDWFILVHVDIEAKAGKVIEGIGEARSAALFKDNNKLREGLSKIFQGLHAINKTMLRMPEHCSPEVYFHRVRPYIYRFENIVYEGCGKTPRSYRGETGAQSSIVPTVVAALGIKHKNSMLTEHLVDMRPYMPPDHRNFIASLEGVGDPNPEAKNVREAVRTSTIAIKELYHNCITELSLFRKKHLEYAIEYIHKKVDDPKGTGGTPYMKWLAQLQEETEEHYLEE